jgi:hypothetical protein
MISGKHFNPCKPLASKGPSKFGPICYVDASRITSGPRLHESERIVFVKTERPVATQTKEEQAVEAAKQWSSTDYSKGKKWIKSWYYPLDSFDPWPERTDLCCWWCSCPFDWSPFPLPYSYDTASNRYRVVGVFCGPSCAKAYAAIDGRYGSNPNVNYFIEHVATEFYGYKLHVKTGASKMCTIPLAPPKEILQKYCGPNGFTIEQYREMCCCGRSLRILGPNLITTKQIIEAQQDYAKDKPIHHVENPDQIQRLTDLVTQKRIPYVGTHAMRITDFYKTKS